MKKLLLALAALGMGFALSSTMAAHAQYGIGGVIPTPASTPTPTFGGGGPAAAAIQSAPVFIAPPVLTGVPLYPLVQPIDVTNLQRAVPRFVPVGLAKGIQQIDEQEFVAQGSGNTNGIMFKPDGGTQLEQTSAYSVKMNEGTVLVSVRSPSFVAIVETPGGMVSLKEKGDVIVSYLGAVLRVDNITAQRERCTVKLADSVNSKVGQYLAVAPGYELVAGTKMLASGELMPPDSIARRKTSIFAEGQLASNEFQIDSVLLNSPIVNEILDNSPDRQERRVLKEMAKMASILNYLHGQSGYGVAAGSGLAQTPGSNTQ